MDRRRLHDLSDVRHHRHDEIEQVLESAGDIRREEVVGFAHNAGGFVDERWREEGVGSAYHLAGLVDKLGREEIGGIGQEILYRRDSLRRQKHLEFGDQWYDAVKQAP